MTFSITTCGIGGKLTTIIPTAKLKEAFKESGVSLDICAPVETFQRAVVANMVFCSREYTKQHCSVSTLTTSLE